MYTTLYILNGAHIVDVYVIYILTLNIPVFCMLFIYRHTLPSVVTRRATTHHTTSSSSSLPLYNAPPQRIGTEPKNMPFISSLQLGSYVEVCTGRASVRDSKLPSWCLGKG